MSFRERPCQVFYGKAWTSMPREPRAKRTIATNEWVRNGLTALCHYRRPLWGAAWLAAAVALVIRAWSLPKGGPPPPPQPGLAALTIMGLIIFFPGAARCPR